MTFDVSQVDARQPNSPAPAAPTAPAGRMTFDVADVDQQQPQPPSAGTSPQILTEEPATPPPPPPQPPPPKFGVVTLNVKNPQGQTVPLTSTPAGQAAQAYVRSANPPIVSKHPDAIGPTKASQAAQDWVNGYTDTMSQPLIDPRQLSDELGSFLVGPFAIHRGAVEAIASAATPANAAIALGTVGAGALGVAGQAIERGAMGYFAAQGVEGAAHESGAAYDAISQGNWQEGLEHFGIAGTQGLLAALAARAAARGMWDAAETFDAAAKADRGLQQQPAAPSGSGPSAPAPAAPAGPPPEPSWLAPFKEAWKLANAPKPGGAPPAPDLLGQVADQPIGGGNRGEAPTPEPLPTTIQGHEEVGSDGRVHTVYTQTGQIDPKATPLLDSIVDEQQDLLNRVADQPVSAGGNRGGEAPPAVNAASPTGRPMSAEEAAALNGGHLPPWWRPEMAEATPAPQAPQAGTADHATPGMTGPRNSPPSPVPTGMPGFAALPPSASAPAAPGAPAVRPTFATQTGQPSLPGAAALPPAIPQQHDYSFAVANLPTNLPSDIGSAVLRAGASIPDDQLAPDGREPQPHVTVLANMHGEDPEPLRKALQDEPPITGTLGPATVLKTPDADVLVAPLISPDLHQLNAKLAAALPNTQTHPVFRPHVTLAYLKPGQGAQYEGQDIPGVTGQQITLPSVAFSDKSGQQTEIPLTGKPVITNGTLSQPKVLTPSVPPEPAPGVSGQAPGTPSPATPKTPYERYTTEGWAEHTPDRVAQGLGISRDMARKFEKRYIAEQQLANLKAKLPTMSDEDLAENVKATQDGRASAEEAEAIQAEVRRRNAGVAPEIQQISTGSKDPRLQHTLKQFLKSHPAATPEEAGKHLKTVLSKPGEGYSEGAYVEYARGNMPEKPAPVEQQMALNRYKIFYNGKTSWISSDTSYHAQQKYAAENKVPEKKRHTISVVLAEKAPDRETKPAIQETQPAEPGTKPPVAEPEQPKAETSWKPADIEQATRPAKPADEYKQALDLITNRGSATKGDLTVKVTSHPAAPARIDVDKAHFAVEVIQKGVREIIPDVPLALSDARKVAARVLVTGVIPAPLASPEKPTVKTEPTNAPERPQAGENAPTPGAVPPEGVPKPGGKRKPGKHAPEPVGSIRPADVPTGNPEEAAPQPGGGTLPGDRLPAGGKPRVAKTPKTSLANDYRITPEDHLGHGSNLDKAQANVAAIRILKQCQAENRPATPEEQSLLAKYTGWGATELSKVFGEPYYIPQNMKPIRKALDELLTPDEFKAAAASTVNAHYTSPMVIGAMWDAMRHMGMEGGERLLEPAMGVGNFFGLEPSDLMKGSSRTGIELDSVTGGIAKLLYPGSHVHVDGFQKVPLPDNFFDVAIGNVPFGNYQVSDPDYRTSPVKSFSIHNYFFAKALDKVRDGGMVAFITSSYTMDSLSPDVRKYLADHADLVGAIRLPHNAFQENAGTQVTTDIIFLRKRAPGTPPAGEPWTNTVEVQAPDKRTNYSTGNTTIPLNEYYAAHPEMMLGNMIVRQGQYGHQVNALEGNLSPEILAAAVARLPEGVLQLRPGVPGYTSWKHANFTLNTEGHWEPSTEARERYMLMPGAAFTDEALHQIYDGAFSEKEPEARIPLSDLPDPSIVKDGGYVFKDKELLVRDGQELKPAGLDEKQTRRVRGMLTVRDAWRNVLQAQESGDEAAAAKARKLLNQAYDIFTAGNGPLSSRDNARAFRGDPDAPGLLALEDYDPKFRTAKKTDIFRRTTNTRYVPPETAPDAASALAIALNEYGGINWARIQKLTGLDREGAERELVDSGLVYRNPEGGRFETADQYLSGNVRDKLEAAIAAAESDPIYEPNVEALKRVQPEDLGPGDIDARLGAGWIPKDVIAQFVAEKLKVSRVRVGHAEAIATWNVRADGDVGNATNAEEYGMHGWTGVDLVEEAMNLKMPTVRVPGETEGSTVVDPVATAALREKQQKLKDLFRQWVWEDPDRATRLAKIYNDGYNNLRLREFDGAHLKLPGSNADIALRPHQKNAIWRMLQGGNTLLAHVVGAGKTYAMIAAAMEMKRLGTAKKSIVVVPNHLVGQWRKEWLQLYPNASLFVADKDTFSKGNRQQAMSRIANGNYDAVIVSHSSFGKLPVSDATFAAWMEEQLKDLEDAIMEASIAEGKDGPTVKDLQKAMRRLEAKLDKRAKREKKDKTLTFEEMGIDQMFVDEAHAYKALFFSTKMGRVAGIPNRESDRAIDMFLKTQWLTRKRAGAGVVFATGTPISNTMAEMYTMMRYLQNAQLRETGLGHFDAWASQYGEGVTSLELAPQGGGYRMNTRFARFVNLPELATAFRVSADVQTADMLKLPTPRIKGGKPTTVVAKSSKEQKALIGDDKTRGSLVYRAAHLPKGPPKKGDDNMLAITGDGRKGALDMRLVNRLAKDNPEGKVNQAVDKIYNIWKENTEKKSTQLVFSDLSTPKPEGGGFSVYNDARDKLIARGIPKEEIAFIHDYDTDDKKKKLFAAVNAGAIRVLFGSTEKMGAGMNVQERLIALHHLDAPWRPSDIEQREGRILRQGNSNPEVQIYRYVTEGSFDAYIWQLLENKARFIAQVMRGDTSVRTAEDVEGAALTYAEIKGIASGSPKVIEKIKTDMEVRRLDALRSEYENQRYKMRQEAAHAPQAGEFMRTSLEQSQEDLARRNNAPDQLWHIGGQTYEGKDANANAGTAIHAMLEAERAKMSDALNAVQAHYAPLIADWNVRYEAAKLAAEAEGDAYVHGSKAAFQRTKDEGQALFAASRNARSAIASEPVPIRLGTYRGFELWTTAAARSYKDLPAYAGERPLLAAELADITVRGSKQYRASSNKEGNPIGTLASIRYHIEDIDTDVKNLTRSIEELDAKSKALRDLIARPFEHEEKLKELLVRQQQLNNELDLNKNMAGTETQEQAKPEQEPVEKETPEEEDEGDDSDLYRDPAAPEEEQRTGKRGVTNWTPENEDGPMFMREAPGFYSQLARTVEQKMKGPSSPSQLLSTLRNPQNGVKPDELKWTGLETWLEDQKGKPVTPKQVQDYLKENQVRLEEVTHGAAEPITELPAGFTFGRQTRAYGGEPLHTVIDAQHHVIASAPTQEEATAHALRRLNGDQGTVAIPQTKFAQYVTPGGENYRELLLTLPTFNARQDAIRKRLDEISELPNREFEAHRAELTEEHDRLRAEFLAGPKTGPYKSAHWEEPNVVAHIRFNDRTGPHGEKILHIEEIQSDWHQEGKRKGYRENPATIPLVAKRPPAEWGHGYWEVGTPDGRFVTNVNDLSVRNHIGGPRVAAEPPVTAEEAIAAARQRMAQQPWRTGMAHAVPQAPFSKTWHELAFRRALRYAAENGYDAVTWTTGEQQAERYGLSKQVSRVEYQPSEKVLRAYDLDGHDILMRGDVAPGDLETYIGKEAATRLLATPLHGIESSDLPRDWPLEKVPATLANGVPYIRFQHERIGEPGMGVFVAEVKPGETPHDAANRRWHNYLVEKNRLQHQHTSPWHELKGEGLKVGGEGMKGFYDKILPDYANKLGKKWGAKVGEANIKTGEDLGQDRVAVLTRVLTRDNQTKWVWSDLNERDQTPFFDSREQAIANRPTKELTGKTYRYLDADNEMRPMPGLHPEITETVHHLPITPSMRESVMEGQPLFNKGWTSADTSTPVQFIRHGDTILANRSAMDAMTKPWTEKGVAGVKLTHAQAMQVRFSLIQQGHQELADAILEAASQPGNGSIAIADSHRSMASVVSTLRHERFHQTQQLLAGHLGSQEQAFLNLPEARIAAGPLAQRGYKPSEIAAEIGASLAAGQYQRLGLTRPEWKTLFYNYLQLLKREHGDKLKEALTNIHPALQEIVRGTTGSPDTRATGRPGQPGPGGLRQGAGRTVPGERPQFQRAGQPNTVTHALPSVLHGAPLSTPLLDAVVSARDDIRKNLNPYALGPQANTAGISLREHAAESARSFAKAEKALEEARKLFATQTWDENLDFINRMEDGSRQSTPELQAIADIMRGLLDSHRIAVQKLGKNKLTTFYENYFPHLWNRNKDAESVFKAIFGKRPIEGTKSFLKQRKFHSFQEGVDAGLTPVSENPVDLVLLKLKEMERYTLAHRFLNEMKSIGLAKFYSTTSKKRPPEGWVKIPDQIGTVWAPPFVRIPEAHDKQFMDTLLDLARDLGVNVQRVAKLRSAWGRAYKGTNKVKTRFAGTESVILHELGHQLDWKYNLANQIVNDPDYKDELRKLADLRLVNNSSAYFQKYVRKGEEKIANMIAAYGHAPGLFKKVAPKTFKWFKSFIDGHPELSALNNLQYGMQMKVSTTEYPVGGFIQTGSYYSPAGVAQIVNNYLAPGFSGKPWYNALRGASNLMLQFALGFSAFHAGFVIFDSMVSRLALAFQYAAAGKPLKAAGLIASIPLAPFSNVAKGNRIRNAYLREALNDPELAKYVDALVQGGGRVSMDAQYRTNMRRAFMDAWRQFGNAKGRSAAKMALTGLPAIAEAAVWPVLEVLVPRMKLGVFADMADFELKRLGPDATPEQKRQAFAGAWDSVDNRMGQLVYDNTFWNRTAKDLMMITVTSLGWNAGTFRELGGAGRDLFRFVRDDISRGGGAGGGGGSGSGRLGTESAGPAGPMPHPDNPQFTRRMAYALALIVLTGLVGRIIDYINMVGRKDPGAHAGEWLDPRNYFFPRTGNVDEQGHEERMALWGYLKDMVAWYMEPGKTASNKLSGILRWFVETFIQNRNWYNEKIWDSENNTFLQDAVRELAHAGSFFVPRSVSGFLRERERGAGAGMQVGSFVGLGTASAYVTRTPAERYMAQYAADHREATSAPSEASKIEREITQALRAGRYDHAIDMAEKASQEGKITDAQLDRAIKTAATDPITASFERLPLSNAIEAARLMNPRERAIALPLLDKKIDNAFKTQSPAEMQRYADKLEKAGLIR
jgi:N12 class adenine-specific DNA methylase